MARINTDASLLETIFYGVGFGRERLSPARIAYLFLVWAVVPMWLVLRFYTVLLGLAFTAGFGALGQAKGLDISFREPFFTWTGDIGLRDLRIERDAQPVRQVVQVRRLEFDMPNWGAMEQMLAAARGGEDGTGRDRSSMLAAVDQIDHIGVSVQGMKADFFTGLPQLLHGFGLASAAPYETEGCQRDTRWLGTELADMGIRDDGVDLQLTLDNAREAAEVRMSGRMEAKGSSRVDFGYHFRAPSFSAFLDADAEHRIANFERLAVTDEGFLAARRAFCAKRDGVTPAEFDQRHLQAIRRRLEAAGLQAGPELERVYGNYLAHGTLVMEAHPSANIPRAQYAQYALADQQAMYNGTLASGAFKPVPVRLAAIPARPAPPGFHGSAWDLVAFEAAQPPTATTMAADSGIDTGTDASTGAGVDAPAPAAASAMLAFGDPADPPTASAPAAAAPVAAPATPMLAAPLASVAVAQRPGSYASSLPAAGGARRGQVTSLDYGQLAQHIGERMLITTHSGDRREGWVESFTPQRVGFRVYVAAGYAIQHIERADIRSIRDLDE